MYIQGVPKRVFLLLYVQYICRKTPLRSRIGRLMLGTLSSFAGKDRPVGKCARIQWMEVIAKKAQTDVN